MALSSCHCPSCLAVVSSSAAAIHGRRFVAMLQRRPEHGDGFEAIEFGAETIGEASKAVGRIWSGRDGLYLPEGTLVELKRINGQPCERVWAAKWSMTWEQVDLGQNKGHSHG